VRERLALVGNAAHTLHPVAGQGFNLGVRDVAVLAEVLVDALQAGEDPGSLAVLNRYGEWRRHDHRNVMVFTDGLARLFTLPLPGLGMARSAGLLALDLLPPAKRLLTRMTMGRSGRTPKLARGLPL
jgi:2-octaprenyl-6-methoxyphenol hydroxylase